MPSLMMVVRFTQFCCVLKIMGGCINFIALRYTLQIPKDKKIKYVLVDSLRNWRYSNSSYGYRWCNTVDNRYYRITVLCLTKSYNK